MSKSPGEATRAAIQYAKARPGKTGFFATLAGLVALVYGGAEPVVNAVEAGLEYKDEADAAHVAALLAQATADQAQAQLQDWIKLEQEKRARAEAESEMERRIRERVRQLCLQNPNIDPRQCEIEVDVR
jgi:hypothetical protein